MKKLGVEYLEMRKSGKFNLEWFFQFYVREYEEFSKIKQYQRMLTFDEFFVTFKQYLQFEMENVLEYLDSVFNVCILTSQDGELLKVLD